MAVAACSTPGARLILEGGLQTDVDQRSSAPALVDALSITRWRMQAPVPAPAPVVVPVPVPVPVSGATVGGAGAEERATTDDNDNVSPSAESGGSTDADGGGSSMGKSPRDHAAAEVDVGTAWLGDDQAAALAASSPSCPPVRTVGGAWYSPAARSSSLPTSPALSSPGSLPTSSPSTGSASPLATSRNDSLPSPSTRKVGRAFADAADARMLVSSPAVGDARLPSVPGRLGGEDGPNAVRRKRMARYVET